MAESREDQQGGRVDTEVSTSAPGTGGVAGVMALTRTRPFGAGLLAVALLLLILMGWRSTALGTLSTMTTIFMFMILAQGWNILSGYGGYLNLGMAFFFGVGVYTTAGLSYHFGWSPFMTAILAGLVAAAFAAVIGYPALRVRGPYFAILTLILTFVGLFLALNATFVRGALGIYLQPLAMTPMERSRMFYFLFLTLAILAGAFVYWVEHSKFGNALVTIREDEDAAEILGVRTTAVKMKALMVGAFIAGIAGGLYAPRIGYVDPTSVFMVLISIDVLLIGVVGGMGAWQGPILGAPIILGLAEFLRVGIVRLGAYGIDLPNELNRLVLGLLLIFVALFARRGVVGLFKRARGRQQGV